MSAKYQPAIEGNQNYAAQVIEMPAPAKHPNADRLEIFDTFGYQVISTIGTFHEGDLAVVFPAETQLSEWMASNANLFRHEYLNRDSDVTGYLEDNRRVRAIRLRGSISSALALPLEEVLNIFDAIEGDFPVGTRFDHIGAVEVCRKYVVKQAVERVSPEDRKRKKAFVRVDAAVFPQHLDTDNFFRCADQLDFDDEIIVTQKLHGTSARFGRVPVRRKLPWYERLAAKLGVKVQETEYDVLAGTRRTIKDVNNPDQKHWYGVDVWSNKLQGVEASIPEGYILYGEIVGYTQEGAPIQKGYTYSALPYTADFYVYRVAVVTSDSDTVDLSWDQVRYFCRSHNLDTVPELWRGPVAEFDWREFEEKNFYRSFAEGNAVALESKMDIPVPLSPGGVGVDEGVVIRADRGGMSPYLLKAKNGSFLAHETALLDKGEVDMESAAAA